MENKKSIVRTAIFKQTINKDGELHIFEITFDNNDKGSYFSKTKDQTAFKEGVETEYTIETKQNGKYTNTIIKPKQAQGNGSPKGNPKYEDKRTALRAAVDLCCAGKITTGEIRTYSDSFMKFFSENVQTY